MTISRYWTISWGYADIEQLVYLVALVEQSAPKLDFKVSISHPGFRRDVANADTEQETPRPNGRTQIACERMVQRLKDTLKDDLVALKAGHAVVRIPNCDSRFCSSCHLWLSIG